MKYWAISTTILLTCLAISSCRTAGEEDTAADGVPEADIPGTLTIMANGEDFVTQGFVSKDGWELTFRHLYVTLENVEAYQTDPPFDPHSDDMIVAAASVRIPGTFTVDLACGDGPVILGEIADVLDGHYNAISWDLVPAGPGPSEGYSIFVDCQAEKGTQSYNVYIGIEQGYRYLGGEYVGDERKGFVEPGGAADLEITFHFDHIFGDASLTADDPLNVAAVGFEPFASLMGEGTVDVDLEILRNEPGEDFYENLQDLLTTLGHTGEGHCLCIVL
jgi:hypothetical protein